MWSQARAIGFIHVPRLQYRNRPKKLIRHWRPNRDDLIRAALIAILATAQKLRQNRLPYGGARALDLAVPMP
jgi:hypothetical protein